MRQAGTFAEVRAASNGSLGLVPTMGYLHEGHLRLMREAREQSDTVVASLFVNPLQFGPDEDLDRYPRDLERDAALAETAGVDVLFSPHVMEMYPEVPRTRVHVADLSDALEGHYRPGHFEGVATVVAKLFAGIQPDRAYFGRKDAQQLAVIKRLVIDLSFPVEVIAVSTVRESDGVALSSRNGFLDGVGRVVAQALSRALFLAADAVESGERSATRLEQLVRSEMEAADGIRLEYVALADAVTAEPLASLDRHAFLAVAGWVGDTRLIDNVSFVVEGDGIIVDRGELLEGPSLVKEH